jgi:hypothetical protein
MSFTMRLGYSDLRRSSSGRRSKSVSCLKVKRDPWCLRLPSVLLVGLSLGLLIERDRTSENWHLGSSNSMIGGYVLQGFAKVFVGRLWQ